jgi:integrase
MARKGSARGWPSGPTPSLTLGGARRKALEAKGEIAEGRSSLTGKDIFKPIAEDYLAGAAPGRSKDWYEKTLTRLVYPTLGDRPIAEIKRSEIVHLLDRVEADSGPVMADTVLATVSNVMNHHPTRDDDFNSPIVKGMARSSARERARKRTLTDDEIKAVWHAEAALTPMVRFLLLTGARHAEARKMPWTDLQGAAIGRYRRHGTKPSSTCSAHSVPWH